MKGWHCGLDERPCVSSLSLSPVPLYFFLLSALCHVLHHVFSVILLMWQSEWLKRCMSQRLSVSLQTVAALLVNIMAFDTTQQPFVFVLSAHRTILNSHPARCQQKKFPPRCCLCFIFTSLSELWSCMLHIQAVKIFWHKSKCNHRLVFTSKANSHLFSWGDSILSV